MRVGEAERRGRKNAMHRKYPRHSQRHEHETSGLWCVNERPWLRSFGGGRWGCWFRLGLGCTDLNRDRSPKTPMSNRKGTSAAGCRVGAWLMEDYWAGQDQDGPRFWRLGFLWRRLWSVVCFGVCFWCLRFEFAEFFAAQGWRRPNGLSAIAVYWACTPGQSISSVPRGPRHPSTGYFSRPAAVAGFAQMIRRRLLCAQVPRYMGQSVYTRLPPSTVLRFSGTWNLMALAEKPSHANQPLAPFATRLSMTCL